MTSRLIESVEKILTDVLCIRSGEPEERFKWHNLQYTQQWIDCLEVFELDGSQGLETIDLTTLTALSFSVCISDEDPSAWLRVSISDPMSMPSYTIVCQDSEARTRMQEAVSVVMHSTDYVMEESPILCLLQRLRDQKTEVLRYFPPVTEDLRPLVLQLTTSIIWSHHLLSEIKLKDLAAWSLELSCWAIYKRGYPGAMVLQGWDLDVLEYVLDNNMMRQIPM